MAVWDSGRLRYLTYPRSEKPAGLGWVLRSDRMFEFITEINCQAPANLGVHGRKVLFKIFSIDVTSNIEEKFTPFRSPYPDFRCFLFNFLADLDSPIFSSEEAFRFLVLTSPTSNSPKTGRSPWLSHSQVHRQLLQNFLQWHFCRCFEGDISEKARHACTD